MRAQTVPPGGVIGILGGGQLGRMTALAAASLGYRTHAFCPDGDSPLTQVTDRATRSSFTDRSALTRFASAVDVVTFEFENIPADTVAYLETLVPVRPSTEALRICQDRLAEKQFVRSTGIDTADYAAVPTRESLDAAVSALGLPAILKTTHLGYDGKGQARIDRAEECCEAWERIGRAPAILERFVAFDRELSVIAARDIAGTVVAYPAVQNEHANHILATTTAPAPIDPTTAETAGGVAVRLAESLGIVGLLSVEMFMTPSGALLVNELAPRPHNSGHWTIDACATSQFEQFVRAITGLPLAPIGRHADAVMTNLLGDDVLEWPALAADPAARLHLYGKTSPRPERKMGHVTRLRPLS